MPLTSGVSFGQFVIRSLLGSGGMGEVYLAHDTRLGRDVALKLLPADRAGDTERMRRFEFEARSASALNHPAIVAIYDLGQAESQPFISMELVQGQTLREILQQGPLAPRRALQVAATIADGLAKAHDAGIVHRDLKPENLMVSDDGFAKILDFGLAKLVDDADARVALDTMAAESTRPGTVLGTAGYMSPEQARGDAADSRSDQFSFGLVLYEMLTGRRAFERSTAVETLSAIIRDDPTPVAELNPSIPVPVRWIVERCLAKRPADRYGSTRDLARDLASARDHFSELTRSGSGATTALPVRRLASAGRRELVAWLAMTAMAIVTAGVIVRQALAPLPVVDRPVRFLLPAPEQVNFDSPFGMSPFAVSPDGRQLAFGGIGSDGTRRLWIHSFDSLVARLLPGTEGGVGPFWSPDGQDVGFFTVEHLKRTSIAGGDVVTICDARGGGGAVWNRDGVIVFAPGIDTPLFRVAAAGGTPTPITTLDPVREETGHVGPLLLPDGRFLFMAIDRENGTIFAASLDSTERTRLSIPASGFGFSAPDILFFLKDRTLLAQHLDLARLQLTGEPMRVAEGVSKIGLSAAFAVSPNGTVAYWSGARTVTQPTWFRRDGTAVGTLGTPAGYMNVAVSRDGRQAAVDRFDATPGIWLLDSARAGTRITFGGIYESTPVWSPDAKAFAFAAARNGPPSLYVQKVGAASEGDHLYGTASQTLFPQSWSHDGRFMAFVSMDPKTEADIWLLALSGERKPVPFLRTQFSETHARISPDGRWLAYVSNDAGRPSVYVTRFPEPGGKWHVSTAGGDFPVWRHDSRELYYRAPDGKLVAVPIGADNEFTPGEPVPLFEPRSAVGDLGFGTFYDVAPDGRFLINILVERTSPPVGVVLNWRADNQSTPR